MSFEWLKQSSQVNEVKLNKPPSLSKENSGVDKITVKKQPYQLLHTTCEFFASFDASKLYKLVESFYVGLNIVTIMYFVLRDRCLYWRAKTQ